MTALLLMALLTAQPAGGEPFEPPLVKRPENFRGAVGRFRLATSAEPVSVAVHQPILLTVTITAEEKSPVLSPPRRPDLEKDEDLRVLFDFDKPDITQRLSERKWEYFYRLKPKSVTVKEIPELTFCYFDPRFNQDPRGYQEHAADPIPITVNPAPSVAPVPEDGEIPLHRYPDSVRSFADDDELLERHRPWTPPAMEWLLILFVGPPVAAMAWWLIWRRLYPDAARLSKLRRSRAARSALAALGRARSADPTGKAEQISGTVAAYLRERFDLASACPTPIEIEAFLRGMRVPDTLREKASGLMQTCDALRFSSVPPAVSGSLADEAELVILELEALTWSSSPS